METFRSTQFVFRVGVPKIISHGRRFKMDAHHNIEDPNMLQITSAAVLRLQGVLKAKRANPCCNGQKFPKWYLTNLCFDAGFVNIP